jgi:photosystem II stability/assembly factor-like uncharacterized protein
MKPKLVLGLALVLNSGLFGCSTLTERPAEISNAGDKADYISEIHMVDAGNGWAWSGGVEGRHLLLHTSDGGRTWMDRTPRAFPYIADGSCFLNSQTAWVSTLDRKNYVGGLLRTTDGGKSWSVLIRQGTASYGCFTENSTSRFFNAHHGVANTADYSAGSVDVCFYKTDNGGKDWKPVVIIPPGGSYANEPPGTIGLSDIAPETVGYCPPENVVITHGDMDDEKPKDAVRLSVSTNLGKQWHDLSLPLPSQKYREGFVGCGTPVFIDEKNGWLPVHIARRNTDETVAWNVMAFYATHDGGETWSPRSGIIDGGTNQFGQFDTVSSKDIFVRCGASLFVTHDGAQSWQIITPDIDLGLEGAKRYVTQMDFVDVNHGWMIISDNTQFSPGGNCMLYKTSNGGTTWTQLPLKFLR